MARKLRLEFPGACYHVINRGNYRRGVFVPKGAAEGFERCLLEACEKFGWRLHAFVVMSNHYHLALETPEPNLSLGMKWLQGTWAMRFNRFRGETGRPFQGRYKALHVEPGPAMAQVCHYIHLNPVRAKLVSAEQLARHERSSLNWLPRNDRPGFFEAATVLADCGGLADKPAGWRRYREWLALRVEEEPRKREEKFGRLSRGWMIGSADFKRALTKDLAAQGEHWQQALMLGAGALQDLREEAWEQKLQAAAKALKINPARLPPKKSAPEKVRLAAVVRATTSASNQWLAERLAMGAAASVSQFVRRFRLAGSEQEPAFQATLSKVKT